MDLLSVQARIYSPTSEAPIQGSTSNDCALRSSLCLRFQLIGLLKTGADTIEWIPNRPIAYCHGKMPTELVEEDDGLPRFYFASISTLPNGPGAKGREY